MFPRSWTTILAAVFLLFAGVGRAVAADDATLLRVFLLDGTTLVSYGEPARVGDRVIFSMPTASVPDPPLQLVNIAASRVDWDRTNRYASAARAARYLDSQAELDYAALSNHIAQALNALTESGDATRRLAIAQEARNTLAAWPQGHYNYRLAEVRQMLSLLDEAIADLRASTGNGRFDFALTAFADSPSVSEPLLPAPTPKEVVEQVLTAAHLAETSSERALLLHTAVAALDRDASSLPVDWVASTRAAATAELAADVRIDRSYKALSDRLMTTAARRARLADVTGLERLVDTARRSDQALGARRPESIDALVTALQIQLDAARQLRLARDRWALRAPTLSRYRAAMTGPLNRFTALRPLLERIKSLAGSTPASLAYVQRTIADILGQATAVAPPEELRASHALFVSAAQLASSAATIRLEATVAGNIARAWDASSAAAGALMLGSKARADIRALLRPPQLR